MNSFGLIENYIFANDFLRFLTGHLKKRKKSCFLKSEKSKIRILEHCYVLLSQRAILWVLSVCLSVCPAQAPNWKTKKNVEKPKFVRKFSKAGVTDVQIFSAHKDQMSALSSGLQLQLRS